MDQTEIEELYVSPIANPLAGPKLTNRALRLVKRQIQAKLVKRGVKEVSKALRKKFKGIVILAADISPIDVISHLPIQCEELGIAYCFVKSRMELGAAAQTKKPTSVVLIQTPSQEDQKGLEKYQILEAKIRQINSFV